MPNVASPDPTLREHAARLLIGTGLDLAAAFAVAAGHSPNPAAPTAVVAAIRDGWSSPDPEARQ